MLRGETGENVVYGIAGGIVGGVGSAVIDALGALKRAVTGGEQVPDVQQVAESDLPEIPSIPEDVTGVVGASKSRARKPSTESGGGGDDGEYYYDEPSGSIWPWLAGLALLGGGSYWWYKRSKRSKKGSKRKRGK